MSDNLRQPSLDARLSAMMDGEVTDEEKARLDAILADDAQAKRTEEKLKQATEHGRALFNEMLKEPVSLSLVRSIKTAPEGRRALRFPKQEIVRQSSSPPTVSPSPHPSSCSHSGRRRFYGRRSVPYDDLCGYCGDPSKAWLDDVASHYRLFSRQSRHLVEIPASESAHIVEWLMATTGISSAYRISQPKSWNSWELACFRQVEGGRGIDLPEPGWRNYRDSFTKFISPLPEKDMRESIRDDIGMVTWQGLQASYVLTGPSSDADLEGLATKVAGII